LGAVICAGKYNVKNPDAARVQYPGYPHLQHTLRRCDDFSGSVVFGVERSLKRACAMSDDAKIPTPKQLRAALKKLTRNSYQFWSFEFQTCSRNTSVHTLSSLRAGDGQNTTAKAMARWFARACPRCNGYVWISIRQPESDLLLQAVNGRCVRCQYRLAWVVIRDGRLPRPVGVRRSRGSMPKKARNRKLRGPEPPPRKFSAGKTFTSITASLSGRTRALANSESGGLCQWPGSSGCYWWAH